MARTSRSLVAAAAVSAVIAVVHDETEGGRGLLAAFAPLMVAIAVLVLAAGTRGFRTYVAERRAVVAADPAGADGRPARPRPSRRPSAGSGSGRAADRARGPGGRASR